MSVTFADIQAAAGGIAGTARRSPVIEVGPSRAPLAGRHACSSSWIAATEWLVQNSRRRQHRRQLAGRRFGARLGHRLGRQSRPGGDARGRHARRAGGDLSAGQHAVGEGRQITCLGAEVVIHGQVWDEANAAALAAPRRMVWPMSIPSPIHG